MKTPSNHSQGDALRFIQAIAIRLAKIGMIVGVTVILYILLYISVYANIKSESPEEDQSAISESIMLYVP